MIKYEEFLDRKTQVGCDYGFEPLWMPDNLFPFQMSLVEWACRKGRAAIFADCLAGETIVHSPDGDASIEDMAKCGKPIRVFTLNGIAKASAPWLNGFGPLFEIVTASGKTIRASSGHRMLARSGFVRLDALSVGDELLVCDGCHPRSSAGLVQLTHSVDAPSSWETGVDYQFDCQIGFHSCGEQPHLRLGIVQDWLPLRAYAHAHILSRERKDGQEQDGRHIRPCQYNSHHSTKDSTRVSGMCCVVVSESRGVALTATLPSISFQQPCLYQEFSSQTRQAHVSSQSLQHQNSKVFHSSYWDSITAIRYVRNDFFYDVNVPVAEHFMANGFWVHNCGLGKTPMQLTWAENVVRKTNGRVLILTPLAVAFQTVKEGEKFGIEVKHKREGLQNGDRIVVTNYERLHYFNPNDFDGVVCDESSILKNFDGETRKAITDFMRKRPYRLLCTATAAPNDFEELGGSSEALGEMGQRDMLTKFFTSNGAFMTRTGSTGGRFWNAQMRSSVFMLRPHAERDYWRWVCSWARAMRKPSDLGFDDGAFKLPPLNVRQHVVKAKRPRDGYLFDLPAVGLAEQRSDLRRTIGERCDMAAQLVNAHNRPAVVWCNLNEEGKRLARSINGAVEVAGCDSEEHKEETFAAFISGNVRVLVTKPTIGGFGLNLQHCAHQTYFPSHSYEQYYQSVRRCWRFGQKQSVMVDMITTDGQENVLSNLQRKADAAAVMFDNLVSMMRNELKLNKRNQYTNTEEIPTWL
jgi:hypothetical protein